MSLDPKLVERIEQSVTPDVADRVLPELGSFTRAVVGSDLLARALVSSDLPDDTKRGFVADLGKGAYADATIEVIVAAAGSTTKPSDFRSALAGAVLGVAFRRAEAAGSIDALERNLFTLSRAIVTSDDLRDALSNPGVEDGPKEKIVAELLDSNDVALTELAKTAVTLHHGRDVAEFLSQWADEAAGRRDTVVAEVRSAVELDGERKTNLVAALGANLGKTVEGRFIVDPTIIGSVIIRIGDEVLDGSVRHRLEQARVALVGAN